MQGKIALEEHFAIPATLADSKVFGAHVWEELEPRLTDFQDKRLRLMDASGVEIMIASLNAPAVQAIHDVKRAVRVAREANDHLAAEIAKRPDRFQRLCRIGDAGSGRRRAGADTLRQGAGIRNLPQIMTTIASMSVFPICRQGILEGIFQNMGVDFDKYIEERKEFAAEFVIKAITG